MLGNSRNSKPHNRPTPFDLYNQTFNQKKERLKLLKFNINMTGSCCGKPAPAAELAPPARALRDCNARRCDAESKVTGDPPAAAAAAVNVDCDSEGCCSKLAIEVEAEDEAPSCCRGKVSPCCDVSCIDRIALRSCGAVDQDGNAIGE